MNFEYEGVRFHRRALLAFPFLFVLLVGAAPIIGFLHIGVDNSGLSGTFNRTLPMIRSIDQSFKPTPDQIRALIDDLTDVRRKESAGILLRELNQVDPILQRSVGKILRSSDDELQNERKDPVRFLVTHPDWDSADSWLTLSRLRGNWTSRYLIDALDMKADSSGKIVQKPADESIFRAAMLRTLEISAVVTVLCVLFGYPLAYLMVNSSGRVAGAVLLLIVIPFWTSVLVRSTAWLLLLQDTGFVNSFLTVVGLIDAPLKLAYTRTAVYLAMSQVLLPFAVLPIASSMLAVRKETLMAASIHGASFAQTFARVYVPQTVPGIASGALLVFVFSLGFYVTPLLVGGGGDQMVSTYIAQAVNETLNWPRAAALSSFLLAVVVAIYVFFNRPIIAAIESIAGGHR
jgi:putative spermidine/putrescine transport system permease protein